ncbi:MAG: hypothetical protein ACO3JL_19415, partial [Myxococcota bacterium]
MNHRLRQDLQVALLLLFSWGLPACFDGELPPGLNIACEEDDDCPAAFLCSPKLARCVVESAKNGPSPSLTGPAEISPAKARAGDTVEVTFRVSSELGLPPAVSLELGDDVAALTQLPTSSPGSFTYSYQVTGDEPEGRRVLSVTLTSAWGDSSSGLLLGAVFFDLAAPRAIRVTQSTNLVRAGVSIDVDIELNEEVVLSETHVALQSATGVRHALRSLGDTESVMSTTYHGAFVPDGSEEEGAHVLQLVTVDAVGNEARYDELASVTFDFTPPR